MYDYAFINNDLQFNNLLEEKILYCTFYITPILKIL